MVYAKKFSALRVNDNLAVANQRFSLYSVVGSNHLSAMLFLNYSVNKIIYNFKWLFFQHYIIYIFLIIYCKLVEVQHPANTRRSATVVLLLEHP